MAFVSGAGPLALGPLAALGFHGEPPYQLALYFYLHGLANGWFTFFLIAVVLHHAAVGFSQTAPGSMRAALGWLVAGSLLTFLQSTLWLNIPATLRVLGAFGGAAQLVRFVLLARSFARSSELHAAWRRLRRAPQWLLGLAVGAWLVKLLLQAAAPLPALASLVNHRFVIIAFLHLFFLGAVTPALLAAGWAQGWWCRPRAAACGAAIVFAGLAVGEALLVALALGLAIPAPTAWLFVSALPLLGGAGVCLWASLPTRAASTGSHSRDRCAQVAPRSS